MMSQFSQSRYPIHKRNARTKFSPLYPLPLSWLSFLWLLLLLSSLALPSKATLPLPAFNFSPALRCILPELLFPCCVNWPLRKAMPSIIMYHCSFSLAERNDCCRGCPGLDDRWLDVCYGCSLQIHEQQKFPSLMVFLFFLECALRKRNLK